VKEAADGALAEIQNERPLPKKLFNALKGNLSGIDEIRLPYDTDPIGFMWRFSAPLFMSWMPA